MQEEWLIEQLSNTIQSRIWKILHAHTKSMTEGKGSIHNIMEMLIESLNMV